VNGYRFICENPFFVYFRKHQCPNCDNKLLRKKVSVIVNSESPEAKNYDFEIADITCKGDVKFTHIEFYCNQCNKYYTVKEIKNTKF